MLKEEANNMNLLSNFSGAGLLDYGLMDGGNKILLQCEADEIALQVLRGTFPDIPKHGDIFSLSQAVYKVYGIDTQNCAFVGGCPCQQHSNANPNKKFMPESRLLYKLVDLCEECKPRFLLVENVEGFTTDPNGLAWLHHNMREIGYQGHSIMFPAMILGAPHKRMRVFILFTRDKIISENDEQQKYIEDFKNQIITMDVIPGIWHEHFRYNPKFDIVKISSGKQPAYVKKALKLIGNAVVYDVALFIGKSLNLLSEYFYDSEIGQKITKTTQPLNNSIDFGLYWEYVCLNSLTRIAHSLGFATKYEKKAIEMKTSEPDNVYIHTLSISEKSNYDTPLASDGSIKSGGITKGLRLLIKDFKINTWISPEFNAWLMGMTACPDLLKNVWKVSGVPQR